MDIEFHYWLTGLVAKRSGFSDDEARTIAYASEYVDENDVCFQVRDRHGAASYGNYISQTMNILKPKQQLMRIYPIFHFVPGEPTAHSARRRDGKMHWLNTTPNNEYANEMLDAAFKASLETRLYRIGVATHAYVDTWAHQNFVGWYDYFNNIGLDPKPDIGHADGEHHPDWISHIWTDNRLVDSEVNNRARFLSAAKGLFEKYCHYHASSGHTNRSSHWPDLEKELIELQGDTYTGSRCKYLDMRLNAYRQHMNWLPSFDETEWFNAAIETEVRGLPDIGKGLITVFKDHYYWREDIDKEKTHWYAFQEAVKEHEGFALSIMSKRFDKMGIALAKT